MSMQKIEQVKKDKGFKIFDLVIYGVICLAITAAFLLFHFLSDRSELDGIRVLYNSAVIYEYDFENGEIRTSDNITKTQNGDLITLTITVGEGYNILEINTKEGTATITDADCNSKSCVHMPSMTNNSNTIICQTHYLVITPLVRVDDGNIIM